MVTIFFICFFSSRRRHTRLQGDWSSDVCSSDLDRYEVIAHRADVLDIEHEPVCRSANVNLITSALEPLVHVDGDCDSIPRIPTVVQVIAVPRVVDIYIIVVIPSVRPVFWPRIHETEPKAAVLESGIPAIHLYRVPVDAEPVVRTKVATIMVFRNAVAVVAATLLPVAVLGLPVACTMLLPHLPLLTLLYTLPLL